MAAGAENVGAALSKVLVFNDTSRYQHYGCDLVMYSIFANLRRRGLRPVSVHKVGTSAEKHFDAIVGRHRDAQAIIVNGEGVIHHDRKHALDLAALGGRAADAGVPAYLINAALFENSSGLYQRLKQYRAVWVRDGESRQAAQAHGIEAELVPDLSFDAVASLRLCARARRGGLVTDSVHPQLTSDLERLARETDSRWQPMCRRVGLPAAGLRLLGARRFVRRVASAEWVLTGRFHTVTTCLATRTPFLALASNTRKIEALLNDVFGSQRRMLATSPSLDAARQRGGVGDFDEAESRALEDYLRRGRAATEAMYDRLLRLTT